MLTADEAKGLQARGLDVKVKKNKDGKSAKQLAAEQAASGYNVWRSWDEPGGIRDELYRLAKENPQLVKLEVLGHTYQGREIIALKLTQGARGIADGTRPAVLYSSTQHAREWISTEVNRRLLNHYIDGWRANDKEIRDLLKNNELWFVVVANPDGYQYTFDNERLWRKNLRDNDNDGQITRADGVDPNRNYPEHFGYDEEGSSSQISSDTYRGPSAGSEPETQAMMSLFDRGRLLVPGQLPLLRAVAAVRRGLADRHAHRGRPDLLRVVGQPRQPGDPRLRAGPVVRRALRDQR